MADYSTLSDAEINRRVAEKRGLSESILVTSGAIDYCNNPKYAWRIIVQNKISLYAPAPDYDEWKAEAAGNYEYDDDFWKDYATTHTNPLRAAMIVFLMICNESVS